MAYNQRKRCVACGEWIHNWCGSECGTIRTTCFECRPPFSTLEHIDEYMRGIDEEWESEIYKSGVVFLSAFHVGTDEQKIAEFTGYSLKEVHKRGEHLRASHIWNGEHIALDQNPDNDPSAEATCLLLCILCADGKIKRRSDSEETAGSQSTAANARTK